MDLTLVPFGYRPSDRAFVDVADVPRGKESGCICYSCKAPLVARQGDVKQWHFAHATRRTYEKTEEKCEFSFFVSVRMMARQVVSDSLQLDLPAYRDLIDGRMAPYGRPSKIEFTVTEASSIVLTEVEVEKTFSGVSVDLVGKIAGFAFVVYFTHPGRGVPMGLRPANLIDRKCGILAIELDRLAGVFADTRGASQSYEYALKQFLSHHAESKRWIFHPRYERARAEAKERAAKLEALGEPTYVGRNQPGNTAEASSAIAKFFCVVCNISWNDRGGGSAICPKCKSHLYVSFRGFISTCD